jgi:hypothetical protein
MFISTVISFTFKARIVSRVDNANVNANNAETEEQLLHK